MHGGFVLVEIRTGSKFLTAVFAAVQCLLVVGFLVMFPRFTVFEQLITRFASNVRFSGFVRFFLVIVQLPFLEESLRALVAFKVLIFRMYRKVVLQISQQRIRFIAQITLKGTLGGCRNFPEANVLRHLLGGYEGPTTLWAANKLRFIDGFSVNEFEMIN